MTAVTELSLRSYGDAPLSHSHAHHQLVLALEGRLEMEVAGKGGQVDAASLVVVAGGETHSCRAIGANRFLVLDWPEDAVDDETARFIDSARRRPFVGLDPAMFPLLRYLGSSIETARIPQAERREWVRLLLRRLANGAAPAGHAYPRRLSRALGFLEANLARPITVAEIANAAAASPRHLHGLFRRHLGHSPIDHLAERRLDRALAALAESDTPIAEIALACGYSDQTALTRALRRRHGVTPAAYRRRRRAMLQ